MQSQIFRLLKKIEILKALLDLKEYNKLKQASNNILGEDKYIWGETKKEFQNILTEIENENYGTSKNLLEKMKVFLQELVFQTPCAEDWNELVLTDDDKIRFCTLCRKNVFKVGSKEEFFKRVTLQQCVAFDTEFSDCSTAELIEELTGSSCMIEIEEAIKSQNGLIGLPAEFLNL